MTLTAYSPDSYNGDGATVGFDINFIFWDNSDIKVIHKDASGVETTWTEGTHYTQTGGDGAVGAITVKTTPTDYTPASGTTLTVKSALADAQDESLTLGGAFPSTTVERMGDKLARLIQQAAEEIGRSLQLPESSTVSGLTMEDPTALSLVRWDALGTTLENVSLSDLSLGLGTALKFSFDSSITMADPGTGDVRFDNATLASVSNLAFSKLTSQTGNPDLSDFIATWGDSSSTIKSHLYIYQDGTPSNFLIVQIDAAVTDNGDWLQTAVTHVDSGGSFTAADGLVVMFSRTGDIGTTGSTGPTGPTGAAGAGSQDFSTTTDPTASDDSANTSGNGTFSINSQWTNTITNAVWVCVDATATSAVWEKIVKKVDLEALETNLALNFFLDAIDHARSLQSLQDGYVDQFEDQTGVDDTNSVNETYDATNDLYSPSALDTVEWSTTSDAQFSNGADKCVKLVIPASEITNSGNAIKVTMESVASTNFKFDNVYIGHQATSPTNVWDTDGGQVEILFGGTSGGEAPAGGSTESDATTFSLDASKNVVLSFDISSDTAKDDFRIDTSNSSGLSYHVKSASNEASATAPTGFSTISDRSTGFIALDTVGVDNMTLIADPVVALAAPDDAHVTLFKEDVDAVTLNTDLLAWASRSKRSFTTTNATNLINDTAHPYTNGQRIILVSSGADLPNGLDSETVYYVVNANTNDYQVSLTSGGAAVTFSDDGTGTHQAHVVTAVTLADEGTYSSYDIISGTADLSGQPSDTDMGLFIQTKNVKDVKIHGQSLQWS